MDAFLQLCRGVVPTDVHMLELEIAALKPLSSTSTVADHSDGLQTVVFSVRADSEVPWV